MTGLWRTQRKMEELVWTILFSRRETCGMSPFSLLPKVWLILKVSFSVVKGLKKWSLGSETEVFRLKQGPLTSSLSGSKKKNNRPRGLERSCSLNPGVFTGNSGATGPNAAFHPPHAHASLWTQGSVNHRASQPAPRPFCLCTLGMCFLWPLQKKCNFLKYYLSALDGCEREKV